MQFETATGLFERVADPHLDYLARVDDPVRVVEDVRPINEARKPSSFLIQI